MGYEASLETRSTSLDRLEQGMRQYFGEHQRAEDGCTFGVFERGCIEVHGRCVMQRICSDTQNRSSSVQKRPVKARTETATGCT